MADIAATFHWQADYMERLSVFDLAIWREKARARFETDPD